MLGDRRGDLWLGTWGQGLFRLHRGKSSRVPLPATPRQSQIRALTEDRDGGVWIGTWYDGLYHYNGANMVRYLTGSESYSNAISALVVDRNGSLWVGTYTGLLKYENGIPRPQKGQVLLPEKMITCVKEMPSGEIFVGTQQGLYVIQGVVRHGAHHEGRLAERCGDLDFGRRRRRDVGGNEGWRAGQDRKGIRLSGRLPARVCRHFRFTRCWTMARECCGWARRAAC